MKLDVNKKNYESLVDLSADLKSISEEINSVIPHSNIIKPEILDSWAKQIDEDINEFLNIQINKYKEILVPGNIIKLNDGNGISYWGYKYWKIIETKQTSIYVVCDELCVGSGDYGGEIKYNTRMNISRHYIFNILEKTKYELVTEEEYNRYVEYLNNMPQLN